MSNPCEICAAVENSEGMTPEIWNTKLYENRTFSILPTIGPLVSGQVMITSKRHTTNLLGMEASEIEDFIYLLGYCQSILGQDILFTEHGSSDFHVAGSCIVHTHIHIIPGFRQYYSILDESVPIVNSTLDFKTLTATPPLDSPYILTFDIEGNSRIYEAYNVHSQMMRKAICKAENRSDWNWRNNQNIDLIKKTIEIWQKK